MKRILMLIWIAALGVSVAGQAVGDPEHLVSRDGGVTGSLVGTVAIKSEAADPETLTELERAKVENLQLRTAYATLLAQSDACKAEVGAAFNLVGQLRARVASEELTAQERQVRQAIEAGHPGFSWDPKTGQFTKKADVPK